MTYTFESGLAEHIRGLIAQKHADGFIYNSNEKLLKRFDAFCARYFPNESTVTYELAARWSEARPGEGAGYHNRRISIVKVLAEYILSLGEDAYIPGFFCGEHKPVLYIPSKEEVKKLLRNMDTPASHNPKQLRLDRECKVLFLLYFCCGLRLSEGRLLKWQHIDLESGTLTILGSKGRKDRLVYLPEDSIPILKIYKEKMESEFKGVEWAFPGASPEKPVSCSGVESCFRRHWTMAVAGQAPEKHPTPHCLRHAFVVERFNEWMTQGIDTNKMLPYLSRYLGHKSLGETYYYYHLVDNAFDTVRQKDSVSGKVIPEVKLYEE